MIPHNVLSAVTYNLNSGKQKIASCMIEKLKMFGLSMHVKRFHLFLFALCDFILLLCQKENRHMLEWKYHAYKRNCFCKIKGLEVSAAEPFCW